MCGISGIVSLSNAPITSLASKLQIMNNLQAHRGPDGEGIWVHPRDVLGLAHRRLSIIDLVTGDQPMTDSLGNWIVYNGEIYNYIELRDELGRQSFVTTSDTEVILRAYQKWGQDCVSHLRGMFAFALWDEARQILFCARDRFGIKPFYYTIQDNTFYFASEIKALLPFMSKIETDIDGFKDYLTFQFCLAGKTLFKDIRELLPAHILTLKNGNLNTRRYWEVHFDVDPDHTAHYFENKLRDLIIDSVKVHLRSDVPVGAYVSGGLDSSAVASAAKDFSNGEFLGFIGKFSDFGEDYDESQYARLLAERRNFQLFEIDIKVEDFIDNIRKVIYYLDYPVAGPGSFSQYMVSKFAAEHRKVVLGGQGGDEIFGGYTRYLVAYFEQCIKGAIDGTAHKGEFIVTYESIIPNLNALKNYKPMLRDFWKEGLFDSMDRRYFRLVNRANDLGDEVRWNLLGDYSPFETFSSIFNGDNIHQRSSYFDQMTHFDFKTLLPALLQVEDRMSMAHGLESRVPLLDHALIELAATIPANIKFTGGDMKHIFKKAIRPLLPLEILNRTDKKGFPTPINQWITGDAADFVRDIFSSNKSLQRDLIDNSKVLNGFKKESQFGRKLWGFLCLELWQQEFHDKEHEYKKLIKDLN